MGFLTKNILLYVLSSFIFSCGSENADKNHKLESIDKLSSLCNRYPSKVMTALQGADSCRDFSIRLHQEKRINLSNSAIVDISILKEEAFKNVDIVSIDLSDNRIIYNEDLLYILSQYDFLEELDLSRGFRNRDSKKLLNDFTSIKSNSLRKLIMIDTLSDNNTEVFVNHILEKKAESCPKLEELKVQQQVNLQLIKFNHSFGKLGVNIFDSINKRRFP
jgi:hypothetical protein